MGFPLDKAFSRYTISIMPKLSPVTMGSFAKELVLAIEPLPDLLKSWELTNEEYETLRANPNFHKELLQATEEVRAMGPDAGFIMRAKILSEDFLEDIVCLMGDKNTPAETRVAIFKHITELARLQPPKNLPNGNYGPIGPSVVFNFGAGMPGVPQTLTVKPDLQLLPAE